MQNIRNIVAPRPVPTTTDKRRPGRIRSELLDSCIGQVVELSGHGMRLRGSSLSHLKPGDGIELAVGSVRGEVTVQGWVRWTRRTGFFRREAGVEFANLTDRARRGLTALARDSGYQRVVSHVSVD
jgi:hypothetical protein